ncbi:MAG: hypothetical protein PWP25_1240 [Sphaerochaeta sp.]|jgi:hypothetical protein|uniref:Outer membrane protein beta-barrel domain-containing protein n=1 Tax=Sphaerochaeta halotolerans TaxID=2293840 RepID=A0A372MJK0_9SPIR|nr:hypothetical protein [Sphaerochaeta halotolerans]MDK2860054.1 hypothetical protein [Sphaerochaeta sp.]MDN5333090.1 hypothetical protein [Sphaerochaeta sp.]RFU95951.1 hypothetical protein DYP60_02810 [Sphaerochaeta halotolerans]
MHKKLLLLGIIVLMIASPLFAGYFDLGITLGTNAHLYEKELDSSRMKLAWGLSSGLTDVWEFDVQVDTRIMPSPFSSSSVSLLMQRTLLGQRSTGSAIAGVGVNTLMGAGIMISPYREEGTLGVSHVLLSLTPVTIGSPVMGKRERMLSLTLAYNLSNGQIGLLFDLIKYDFYVVGTYKDYL